jgi:hypothetical protein
MEDYYLKFHIDEMKQQKVFVQFKEIIPGEKTSMQERAIPLDLLAEKEPKLLEMVAGEIIGVYYERRGKDSVVSEVQNGIVNVPILEEDIQYIEELSRKIAVEKKYDDLLKPPTVDEQVEDFIKEFFENDDTEPLEQKDFLAEFFDDISESTDEEDSATAAPKDVVAEHFANVEEEILKEKDFLAEFFEELESDEQDLQPAY